MPTTKKITPLQAAESVATSFDVLASRDAQDKAAIQKLRAESFDAQLPLYRNAAAAIDAAIPFLNLPKDEGKQTHTAIIAAIVDQIKDMDEGTQASIKNGSAYSSRINLIRKHDDDKKLAAYLKTCEYIELAPLPGSERPRTWSERTPTISEYVNFITCGTKDARETKNGVLRFHPDTGRVERYKVEGSDNDNPTEPEMTKEQTLDLISSTTIEKFNPTDYSFEAIASIRRLCDAIMEAQSKRWITKQKLVELTTDAS